MNNPALLTEREAASFLRLAPATLARWRWRGDRGPRWRKLGGAVRYSMGDLEAFLDDSAQTAEAAT